MMFRKKLSFFFEKNFFEKFFFFEKKIFENFFVEIFFFEFFCQKIAFFQKKVCFFGTRKIRKLGIFEKTLIFLILRKKDALQNGLIFCCVTPPH